MTKQLLTPTAELELVRQAQGKRALKARYAMNKLVKHNQGLVHKIVNKFPIKNASCTYDDLFQEGVLGLIHGIQKFDTTRGYRLSTYCYNWILAYVRRYYQNHGRTVRVPVHMSDKQLQLNKQIEALTSDLGRFPTPEEIQQVNEDKSDQFESCVDADILLSQLKADVSPRDYQMLQMRYGLHGEAPSTLQEVAELFDLTRARVHQIERQCLTKMRQYAS
jgi:RNA polymerase sigma factor (sigma-70 family)